ncbi:hypothetical protein GYMLUDRAFT_34201 [Collybiopsis luxurians FD-317 M1]|nr:hypothetical protein GYMLUDRAFT_34201 [Collybiopsis luxurians FD-317 M1]
MVLRLMLNLHAKASEGILQTTDGTSMTTRSELVFNSNTVAQTTTTAMDYYMETDVHRPKRTAKSSVSTSRTYTTGTFSTSNGATSSLNTRGFSDELDMEMTEF